MKFILVFTACYGIPKRPKKKSINASSIVSYFSYYCCLLLTLAQSQFPIPSLGPTTRPYPTHFARGRIGVLFLLGIEG